MHRTMHKTVASDPKATFSIRPQHHRIRASKWNKYSIAWGDRGNAASHAPVVHDEEARLWILEISHRLTKHSAIALLVGT